MSVNKVIILGRIGQQPEFKNIPSGAAVINFSVATTEYYKKKGEEIFTESTEWVSCQAWDKLAENCNKFLRSGSNVYVEGKLKTRSWENKEGKKVYKTEVVANVVKFLDSPNKEGDMISTKKTEPAANYTSDSIPF